MLALDAACDFDDKVFIPLILQLKGTGMLSLRGTTKLRGKNEPNFSALALIDDDNSRGCYIRVKTCYSTTQNKNPNFGTNLGTSHRERTTAQLLLLPLDF